MTHLETETDLRAWLAHLNLADRAESFLAAGRRGEKLLELTREELADLGVPKDQRGAVMLAVADDPGRGMGMTQGRWFSDGLFSLNAPI